ncbi:hypothetical protein F0562_017529 [Nyssa sinensis]|uniref:Uncharacterized protein n=1 Tax=Nyssa sinensis TaxID=561372 RepID=A0A5J4ZGS6_9ASTE|nr:hypothetical protein F0562_017529 [Nyssa sinensis]
MTSMEELQQETKHVGKEDNQAGRSMEGITIFVEELQQEKKLVGKDVDQASGVSQQAISTTTHDELEKGGNEVVVPIEFSHGKEADPIGWLMGTPVEEKSSQSMITKPKLPKIPLERRETDEFQKYYEPRAVSIGPYHHGKPQLKQVEDLKLNLVNQFLCREGVKKPDELFNKFADQIKEFRSWYDEPSFTERIDEEKFVRMMFLDGCFVLMYISCVMFDELETLGIKNQILTLIQQDLWLLENQLPFAVFECLWEWEDNILPSSMMLCWFIDETFSIRANLSYFYSRRDEKKPSHLLDLLRMRFLGQDTDTGDTREHSSNYREEGITKSRLLRNVKELTAAGIHLKLDKSARLADIKFSYNCFHGKLTLPPITINGSTKTIFLNMIAYEMDNPQHYQFTSYLCFLDSLIDNADDVSEMRSAGVLENFLGSDHEVAELINQIGNDLVPEKDVYKSVKREIRRYFSGRKKVKVATWIAQVSRDHFGNPWTTIAIFAAAFAILLSVVQTYYTIFPLADKCNCNYLNGTVKTANRHL